LLKDADDLINNLNEWEIFVNNQLDAQFYFLYLFQLSTCFEQPSAHHQESQCINTTSGRIDTMYNVTVCG